VLSRLLTSPIIQKRIKGKINIRIFVMNFFRIKNKIIKIVNLICFKVISKKKNEDPIELFVTC
jgi:hypothetical protein